jgi:hypothetical protein
MAKNRTFLQFCSVHGGKRALGGEFFPPRMPTFSLIGRKFKKWKKI